MLENVIYEEISRKSLALEQHKSDYVDLKKPLSTGVSRSLIRLVTGGGIKNLAAGG